MKRLQRALDRDRSPNITYKPIKTRPLSEVKRQEFKVRLHTDQIVVPKKLTVEEEKTRVEMAKDLVKKFNIEKKEREKEKLKYDDKKKKK